MQKSDSISKFAKDLISGQQGLSLLEILIGITLLSLIALATTQIVDNSFKTVETVLTEDDESLQVQTALARLEWDISQIYSPLYYSNRKVKGIYDKQGVSHLIPDKFARNERFAAENQLGHPVPRFRSPDVRTFEFFTASNRRKIENSRESNFAWVRYTLAPLTSEEREENTAEGVQIPQGRELMSLVRSYASTDPFSETDGGLEQAKVFTLLKNVTSLRFSYWDPEKKKYVEDLKEIRDGEHKLRGIMVELSWINTQTGVEESTTRVFRPLWPYFEPEDLAKIQREVNEKAGRTNRTTSNPPR